MLDPRDLQILAALQQDGRATYADVARRVGLSASSVHERVRKLEQQGVIRGYRAEVDPETVTFAQVEANIVRCPDAPMAERMMR